MSGRYRFTPDAAQQSMIYRFDTAAGTNSPAALLGPFSDVVLRAGGYFKADPLGRLPEFRADEAVLYRKPMVGSTAVHAEAVAVSGVDRQPDASEAPGGGLTIEQIASGLGATFAGKGKATPRASAFPLPALRAAVAVPFPAVSLSASGAATSISSGVDVLPGAAGGGNNLFAAWAGGTTYTNSQSVQHGADALGAPVTWKSLQNSNTGNTPADGSAWWSRVTVDPRFAFLNAPASVYGKGVLYGVQRGLGSNLTPCVGLFGDVIEFVVPGYNQSYRVFVDGVVDPVSGTPLTGLAAAAVGSGGTFTAGTKYWSITAITAAGETVVSAQASATIVLNGSADLTWDALPSGTTGVNVYRGTVTGTPSTLVATLGAVTSYTDTGIAGTSGVKPPTSAGWRYLGPNLGPYRIKLTFASVASRTIAVQLNGGQLYNVTVAPAGKIYAPNLPNRTNLGVMGDSQAYGTNSGGNLFDAYPQYLSRLLGWNVVTDGEPGTGFINVNATQKYVDRIPLLAALHPDVCLVQASSNDDRNLSADPVVAAADFAEIRGAVTTFITTYRAYTGWVGGVVPPLIITGQIMTVGPADGNAAGYNRQQQTYLAVREACQLAGVPFLDTDQIFTSAMSGFLPDGLHPNVAGQVYVADRFAAKIPALLGASGLL